MKNIIKKFSLFLILFAIFSLSSCVHDDDYSVQPNYECTDLTANISIAELKAMYNGQPTHITQDLIVEGYVVSSDETGNVYKTLYIQDAPENPTQGLTISVDQSDLYTKFPFGYKVFIKLKDLWLGEYGSVIQVGDMGFDYEINDYDFGRIPSLKVDQTIILGCVPATIVPKLITMSQFNDNLVGALIQLDNVEVDPSGICEPYALPEITTNRLIKDCNGSTVALRNSGYASFANNIMPAGQGTLRAVLSKFNSTYQLYLNDEAGMAQLVEPRCDGSIFTCTPPETSYVTIQDIKDLYNGDLTQITSDLNVEAVVTANDETGNLYKLIYIEDETGGIRLRLNKTNLYYNPKYYVGSKIIVNVKDLYIDDVSGELQLGGLYNGNLGNIEEDEIYLHVFGTGETEEVTPTVLTLADLSADQVGKLVKFDNLEFIGSDVGVAYAPSGTTNRTLQDCDGNTITLRTSSYATFAASSTPGGNGSITAILSIYNGTYQLWLRNTPDIDMQAVRCDGSVPPQVLFDDNFDNGLGNWTSVNVAGAQVWGTQTLSGNTFAKMSGYSGGAVANEDWLISNSIDLSGVSSATLTLDSDTNYDGNALETFIATNFTGDPATTSWTTLNIPLDPNNSGWGFFNSGNVSLDSYAGQTIYLAFKYTSTSSAAATWEIDNVKVTGN